MSGRPADDHGAVQAAVRSSYRQSFDDLNERVATTKFDRYLRFLNFGYALLDGEAPAGPALPRNFPNRDSAQLLFNVVGGVELTGLVGEVGCGRGGNIGVLLDFLGVQRAVGLDLARANLEFCRRCYAPDRARFVQAGAEALPLRGSSIDVLLNVESSGCYPDIESFFREVARVVRVGGHFLWADLARREMIAAYRRVLARLGFEVVGDRDITANVVAARQARAERQRLALGDGRRVEGFDDWVGAGGSELHDQLVDPRCAYQIMRARRAEHQTVDAALFTPEERALALEFSRFGARVLGESPPSGS